LKPIPWVLPLALLVCGLVAAAPGRATAAPPPLFGTVEFRAASLAALPQWQRVLERVGEEAAAYRACDAAAEDCPSRGVMAWRALGRSQRGGAPHDQLRAVNRFVNNWEYKADAHNYGRRDYWASPLEFLRRSGDCEDYAITKYVTLRGLGYEPERLRLVVVHDVLRDVAHAVLAVYLDDEVYILDNLTNAVLPQDRVTQYVPYYSINEEARWAHVAPLAPMLAARATGVRPGAEGGAPPAAPEE
jgi:predicted transglutaminase-like cysteine proteinase